MDGDLRRAYDKEMTVGTEQYASNKLREAFYHLERAHILGQSFSLAHARVHWWMLKVGWKRGDLIEITGQIGRIVGAWLFSRIWVPVGNTGGAHVSPFQSMPIPEEFKGLLQKQL